MCNNLYYLRTGTYEALHILHTFCLNRISARCLGTIVPVPNIPEFPLENEPIFSYKKGSPERAELEKALDEMSSECEEVPLVIGDEEIKSDLCRYQVMVRYKAW